jgi:hypothetical protein
MRMVAFPLFLFFLLPFLWDVSLGRKDAEDTRLIAVSARLGV